MTKKQRAAKAKAAKAKAAKAAKVANETTTQPAPASSAPSIDVHPEARVFDCHGKKVVAHHTWSYT